MISWCLITVHKLVCSCPCISPPSWFCIAASPLHSLLERQPGADGGGYSGLEDEVDHHWLRRAGRRRALDHSGRRNPAWNHGRQKCAYPAAAPRRRAKPQSGFSSHLGCFSRRDNVDRIAIAALTRELKKFANRVTAKVRNWRVAADGFGQVATLFPFKARPALKC